MTESVRGNNFMAQYRGCNVYVSPIVPSGFQYGGEVNGSLVACGFSFSAQSYEEARALAERMIDRNFKSSLNVSPVPKKKRSTNPGRT
jgi:hypothetical protein